MMKKINKDNKVLLPRMNPMEERGPGNDLFAKAVPVWYSRSGKVNPIWLSACREQRAKQVRASITKYITGKLKLKVNEIKSRICKGYELNFLGHSILKDWSLGLSKASEVRLKDKVREITKRSGGISLEDMLRVLRTKLQGWLNYFRYARMSSKLEVIDGWIRRKLKCFRLKQCKRKTGIVRCLRKPGVEETLSWRTALSGKRWWRLSNSPALSIGMNKIWFAHQGYYSLSENYKSLHRKTL